MGRIPKANRKGFKVMEFDEKKRLEYLTGFQKRNREKKKKAEERRKEIYINEQKRIKNEKKQKLKEKYEEACKDIEENTKIQMENHLITITNIDNIVSNGLHLGGNNLLQKEEWNEETEKVEKTKDSTNIEKKQKPICKKYSGNNRRKMKKKLKKSKR